MSERVLNQTVYSLIKELGMWTGRRVKGVRCKCKCSVKCKHEVKCEHGAKCEHGWGKRCEVSCVRWGVFCSPFFICMYRWYKYKGYGRCRRCSVNTIECMISSKTKGVHKRGSWSGDGLWDNVSCGLLIAQWDSAHDLMSLPRPRHIKPRRGCKMGCLCATSEAYDQAVAVVQLGLIGNVQKVKMGGIWA